MEIFSHAYVLSALAWKKKGNTSFDCHDLLVDLLGFGDDGRAPREAAAKGGEKEVVTWFWHCFVFDVNQCDGNGSCRGVAILVDGPADTLPRNIEPFCSRFDDTDIGLVGDKPGNSFLWHLDCFKTLFCR